MKFNLLAIFAGLAQFAAAQTEGLPTCAQSCVSKFTTGSNIGGCPSLDIKCICSSPTFLSGIACCLSSVCSPSDQAAAVSFAKNFCSVSGVTNLPDSVVCSNATSAAPSTPAITSSAAAATGSSGAHKVEGVGAGIFGMLAMGLAILY